jgi:hypothetical protein
MSGTFNIMLASFAGGSGPPVGLLAYLADTRVGMDSSPKIAIKNDLLYLALETKSSAIRNSTTVANLPLDLSTITWQTHVATATSNDRPVPTAITVDSSGNVIVAGNIYVEFNDLTFPYVLKVNSSGTFQWHRYVNSDGTFNAVVTDASDDIYPVGTCTSIFSTRDDIVVAKYNASGTRQFFRELGTTATPTTSSSFGNGVALLNGTDYCVASRVTPSSFDGCLWTLAQSDGAKVAATFQNNASNTAQSGVAVIQGETADVLYYLVNTFATGSISSQSTQVLLKFTTADGYVWQSFLTDGGGLTTVGTALCMDPSNTHVYVVGFTTGAVGGRTEVLINKWTTAGSLVWQRGVTSPTQNLVDPRIAVDSLDNIYVTFRSSPHVNGQRGLVMKMPGSGAGSGNSATVDGFTYNYITTSRTTPTDALTISTNSNATQADTAPSVTPGSTITTGVLTITTVPF